jgi:hypothetical protein
MLSLTNLYTKRINHIVVHGSRNANSYLYFEELEDVEDSMRELDKKLRSIQLNEASFHVSDFYDADGRTVRAGTSTLYFSVAADGPRGTISVRGIGPVRGFDNHFRNGSWAFAYFLEKFAKENPSIKQLASPALVQKTRLAKARTRVDQIIMSRGLRPDRGLVPSLRFFVSEDVEGALELVSAFDSRFKTDPSDDYNMQSSFDGDAQRYRNLRCERVLELGGNRLRFVICCYETNRRSSSTFVEGIGFEGSTQFFRDKETFVYFLDQIANAKRLEQQQRLLAVAMSKHGRLGVGSLLDAALLRSIVVEPLPQHSPEQQERMLAAAMSQHGRLGLGSLLGTLDADLLRLMLELQEFPHNEPAEFISSW